MPSALHGTVGILGFGVDGQEVGKYLATQPKVERVVVLDNDIENCRLKVQRYPATFSMQPATENFLDGINLLFRSPGFPITHPVVKAAKKRGIAITSSTIEVLKNFPGITVGITGSNGKTTCVALIEEFLKAEFGADHVERGGNDGIPRLDLLCHGSAPLTIEQKNRDDIYLVLELSSFQLIDSPVSPNIAVVLNISPNHLDWHKDMEEYAEAKRQIVAHQTGEEDERMRRDIAVLNQNDPVIKTFAEGIESTVHWFSEDVPLDEVRCISHPDTIRAAVTAARALKVSEESILKVLREFPGVPHRLEFIRELEDIKWYNDSSCTTPESAIVACEAFPVGSLTLLIGGRDKGMDFSRMYKVIKERDVAVVPYGEMAATFQKNIAHSPQLKAHSSFEEAIEVARSTGRPNVALSPACASFDMFANAKERGRAFTSIVKNL